MSRLPLWVRVLKVMRLSIECLHVMFKAGHKWFIKERRDLYEIDKKETDERNKKQEKDT